MCCSDEAPDWVYSGKVRWFGLGGGSLEVQGSGKTWWRVRRCEDRSGWWRQKEEEDGGQDGRGAIVWMVWLEEQNQAFFFCPDTFIRFHLHHNTFLLFKYLYLDISKSEIYNRVSSGFEKYEGRESEFLPLHPNNIKKKSLFFTFSIFMHPTGLYKGCLKMPEI